MDSVFGAVIAILHSDCESCLRQQSRRRAAVAIIRLVKQLLRRESNPRYETIYTGGAQEAPETSSMLSIDDGGPCAGADGADWSGRRGHRRFGQIAF